MQYILKKVDKQDIYLAKPKKNQDGKMKKLKHIELTHQEWLDALRCPTPVRNKKKYKRKDKHKNKNEE